MTERGLVLVAAFLVIVAALILGLLALLDVTDGLSPVTAVYGDVVCIEDRDPWGNLESPPVCIQGGADPIANPIPLPTPMEVQ